LDEQKEICENISVIRDLCVHNLSKEIEKINIIEMVLLAYERLEKIMTSTYEK
jgi:hypothetical protein